MMQVTHRAILRDRANFLQFGEPILISDTDMISDKFAPAVSGLDYVLVQTSHC
jgi:hypothetical protein